MDNYSTPKKMKLLGDLFEKYKVRFKAPQATVEKACVRVINEVTGYNISINQITYTVSTKTIYLQVPSILKSELKFHHTTILQKLNEQLGRDGSPHTIL